MNNMQNKVQSMEMPSNRTMEEINKNQEKYLEAWHTKEKKKRSKKQLEKARYRFIRQNTHLFKKLVENKYDYSEEPVEQEWGSEVFPGRTNWASHLDYLMAGLGYIIGLGNLYSFPYECFKYGGIVYLIPYTISLVVFSMPLMLVEIGLGQYTSHGPISCWEMAPIFKAIGVGMMVIAVPVGVYTNMVLGWSIFYIYESLINLGGDMPWTTCDNSYNSAFCSKRIHKNLSAELCMNLSLVVSPNGVCYNNSVPYGFFNITKARQYNITSVLPTKEYFNNYVLGLTDEAGFDKPVSFRWESALMLFSGWLAIYMALFNGVQTSGKVSYITVTLPVAFLTGILLYFFSLPEAREGMTHFYLNNDWSQLGSLEIWENAAAMTVFTTTAVGGGLVVLSSYNSFHNNILRDMLIFTTVDYFCCLLCTFVIFGAVGIMANLESIPIEDAAAGGVSLVFELFPYALSNLPGILSVIFFICLFSLGFDSQFFFVETLATSCLDIFPQFHQKTKRRLFLAYLSLALFTLGLPMCTEGGIYVFEFLNTYTKGGNLLMLGLLECVCVAWFYGVYNFQNDIGVMMGDQKVFGMLWPKWARWWNICWKYVSPTLLGLLALTIYTKLPPITYGNYEYPSWAGSLGLLVAILNFAGIWLSCMYTFARSKGSIQNRFKEQFTPRPDWGPALVKHRVRIVHLKESFDIDPHWIGSDNIFFYNEAMNKPENTSYS